MLEIEVDDLLKGLPEEMVVFMKGLRKTNRRPELNNLNQEMITLQQKTAKLHKVFKTSVERVYDNLTYGAEDWVSLGLTNTLYVLQPLSESLQCLIKDIRVLRDTLERGTDE